MHDRPRATALLAFSLSSPTNLPPTFSQSTRVAVGSSDNYFLLVLSSSPRSPLLPLSIACVPSVRPHHLPYCLTEPRPASQRLIWTAHLRLSPWPLAQPAALHACHKRKHAAHHGGKYLLLLAWPAAAACALPRPPANNGQTLMGIGANALEHSIFVFVLGLHACIRVVTSIRTQLP
jgi:hypothetical protein